MPEEAVLEAPAELETPSEAPVEETEQPEGEVSDIGDETEESSEEAPEEEEGTETETPEEVTPDGRKMPDGLKKAIASLKTTSPEVAKQIKGLYYAEQAYREVFPKPEEAIAAKSLIEEVGGAEGIQQITAERQEWNEIDQAFGEGKPEFVKGLAESNPEAFLKTAPHVINEFAARAPEQYQYYANNVAVNTLASAGVSLQNLANAYNQYGDGTGKETPAQAIIAEIHGALSGIKKSATEFEQKRSAVDPREEALKQRETAFEQQRRADFEGNVAGQAEKYLAEKMQPELDRVIAGRKIDPEAMKGYQKMVQDEVMRKLGEVPGFADRLEAHYRTGDQKKSVEYIQAQYNRILPEAAKVIAPFLRNIAPGKVGTPKNGAAATPGRTPSAGEVVLKEMPDWTQVDQSKTTVADMIQGHAILKNGKKASGWV
jgi:hypothetical protein